jgi:hypothetical protein
VRREGPIVPKHRSLPNPPPLPPEASRLARFVAAYVWTLLSWMTPALLPMLLLALVLFGLVRVGQAARADLCTRERYRVSFPTVECLPPSGLDRDEFLSEVQYLTGWPDRVCLLDDDLSSRLAGAFARHPWVEQVESVTLGPDRSVRVRLRFRTPILAVRYGGQLRAVDAQGILLPITASTRGLPRYEGVAATPKGPAGTPWGDPGITAAASHEAVQ